MILLFAWLALGLLAAGVVVWNVWADRAAARAVEAGLRRDRGWQSGRLQDRAAHLRRRRHKRAVRR